MALFSRDLATIKLDCELDKSVEYGFEEAESRGLMMFLRIQTD